MVCIKSVCIKSICNIYKLIARCYAVGKIYNVRVIVAWGKKSQIKFFPLAIRFVTELVGF